MALAKGCIINADTENTADRVDFVFNPSEFTIAKSVSWTRTERIGENVPDLSFSGGEPRTLKMNLLFDVLEEQNGNVNTHIDKLWKFVFIDSSTTNSATQKGRPPMCRFMWGEQWSFKAVVTSLNVTYTLFREDGTPVRAKADIQMDEVVDESKQPGTNPTSFGEAGLKRREVLQSDTLAGIAYQEYGDPNQWRLIAEANALDNPLDLRAGQVLAIPSL